MQVLTRARGGCVVHRFQTKNPRERLTEWRHALEARGEFWEIWKSQFTSPVTGEDGWLLLARGSLGQVPHEMVGGGWGWGWYGRWKSQNRKNVYLSPYVKEPLNSKVIKSFVPELRSRKCFSCFEIPIFVEVVCSNLVISVDVRPSFTGIAL